MGGTGPFRVPRWNVTFQQYLDGASWAIDPAEYGVSAARIAVRVRHAAYAKGVRVRIFLREGQVIVQAVATPAGNAAAEYRQLAWRLDRLTRAADAKIVPLRQRMQVLQYAMALACRGTR